MKKNKKQNKKKTVLLSKHRIIADMYSDGCSVSKIAKELSLNWRTVDKIIKSDVVQTYLRKKQEDWEDMVKFMQYKLLDKVGSQILNGVVIEKKIFKNNELVSRIVITRQYGMKELMDMSRLCGRYNPSLKVVKETHNEKDNDENYSEVLAHIEAIKKREEESQKNKKIH